MSLWHTLFGGWRFRAAQPGFQPGERLTVYVTGYEDGEGRVRIGDSVLALPGVGPEAVDRLMEIRVVAFDAGTGRGRAEPVSAD